MAAVTTPSAEMGRNVVIGLRTRPRRDVAIRCLESGRRTVTCWLHLPHPEQLFRERPRLGHAGTSPNHWAPALMPTQTRLCITRCSMSNRYRGMRHRSDRDFDKQGSFSGIARFDTATRNLSSQRKWVTLGSCRTGQHETHLCPSARGNACMQARSHQMAIHVI